MDSFPRSLSHPRSWRDLRIYWSDQDIGRIFETVMILDGSRGSSRKQGSWTALGDYWSNRDIGRIFEITERINILDWSSNCLTKSRSRNDLRDHRQKQGLGRIYEIIKKQWHWIALRDHWSNQGLERIFEITGLTKVSVGSSKYSTESRSWNDLRDHRDNKDLGRIFEINKTTRILDESARSLIHLNHGLVSEISQPPEVLEGSSNLLIWPRSPTDLRDNHDLGRV